MLKIFIPILISSGYIIDKELIENQSKIKISFENDSITHEIKLTKDRMICFYKNNFYSITIIEIKDYDILKAYNYLELDEESLETTRIYSD